MVSKVPTRRPHCLLYQRLGRERRREGSALLGGTQQAAQHLESISFLGAALILLVFDFAVCFTLLRLPLVGGLPSALPYKETLYLLCDF